MDDSRVLTLQIETRGNCQARCHFCPYKESMDWRAGGVMDERLFYRLMDEVEGIPQIGYIIFHGLNEPLLDARLERFIEYAKEKRPDVVAVAFSNGVLLTPSRFDSLKAAGLNTIVISLNANTPEQHEKIMGLKGKFEQTVQNIVYAQQNREHVEVEVHAVVNRDTFPTEEGIKFIERWGMKGRGGIGLVVWEGNWAGDNRLVYEFKPNQHCYRATTSIYVLYSGVVSACCFDPYGKEAFGDLSKQTLREVYNSPKYVRFRQDHVNDEADKWEICKNCTRI